MLGYEYMCKYMYMYMHVTIIISYVIKNKITFDWENNLSKTNGSSVNCTIIIIIVMTINILHSNLILGEFFPSKYLK